MRVRAARIPNTLPGNGAAGVLSSMGTEPLPASHGSPNGSSQRTPAIDKYDTSCKPRTARLGRRMANAVSREQRETSCASRNVFRGLQGFSRPGLSIQSSGPLQEEPVQHVPGALTGEFLYPRGTVANVTVHARPPMRMRMRTR